MDIYDVIIVGAGPAGFTSAIYTSRQNLKTLVLSKDLGGQTAKAFLIENYPGFEKGIVGLNLIQKIQAQAKRFGAEIIFQEVDRIKKEGNLFKVITSTGDFRSRALILAFGLTPRDLGVPGEERLEGKGVSYCATCDAFLYRGKRVIVVGGGNSGICAALALSKMVEEVILVHIQDKLVGEAIIIEKLKKAPNVKFILNSEVVEIKGQDSLESVLIKNRQTEEIKEEKVDGVFIEVGMKVESDWLKELIKLDKRGQIIINEKNATSQKGIFAAGDITTVPYKQCIIAASEGAKAAISTIRYVQSLED